MVLIWWADEDISLINGGCAGLPKSTITKTVSTK